MTDPEIKEFIETRLAGRSSVDLRTTRGELVKPRQHWARHKTDYLLSIQRKVNQSTQIEYIVEYTSVDDDGQKCEETCASEIGPAQSPRHLSDRFLLRIDRDGTILSCVYQLLGSETQAGLIFSAERATGSYVSVRNFMEQVIHDIGQCGYSEQPRSLYELQCGMRKDGLNL